MKKILLAGAASVAAAVLTAGAAFAVPPHQHFIDTPAGTHAIGGDTCDGPMPHEPAFHNLHDNVHVGVPGTQAMDGASNPTDISAVFC